MKSTVTPRNPQKATHKYILKYFRFLQQCSIWEGALRSFHKWMAMGLIPSPGNCSLVALPPHAPPTFAAGKSVRWSPQVFHCKLKRKMPAGILPFTIFRNLTGNAFLSGFSEWGNQFHSYRCRWQWRKWRYQSPLVRSIKFSPNVHSFYACPFRTHIFRVHYSMEQLHDSNIAIR